MTKKERKIKTQQKMIEHLKEENEYLKEQLRLYADENVKRKVALTQQAYENYISLSDELIRLKEEYQRLIQKFREDREILKRKYI